MKLIITGASGYLATEILRQSLRHEKVTSVVAVARKPVAVPEGTDASKLKSVVIGNYEVYPDEARKEFASADACIWTVAITPFKSKQHPFETVRKVCHDAPLAGLAALHESAVARPFRFIYVSGSATERDQTKTPAHFPEYSLMRGKAEADVLAFAAARRGQVDACIAKAGFITGNGGVLRALMGTAMRWTGIAPTIALGEVAAAILDQAVNGFEMETMENEDMVRIGGAALKAMKA